MSKKLIVKHCAPTMAGMKTGNLFSCMYESEEQIFKEIRCLNKLLVPKGLKIVPLRFLNNRVLIYAYRPARLRKDFMNYDVEKLLKLHGYSCDNPEMCVAQLAKKLQDCSEFPHEIGLFLGYPADDVYGFIENNARKCKCVGCWKVYGDEVKAQKLFNRYKKCTDIYCSQLSRGRSIERLTVAV